MPDSTNNHGGSWDLTIPTGSDSPDVPRDMKQLGLDVDAALSDAFVGGINVDTAGTTDFSSATAPLSLYGTGGLMVAKMGLTILRPDHRAEWFHLHVLGFECE